MTSAETTMFRPIAPTVAASQMTAFVRFCEARTGRSFVDHTDFHRFTVEEFRSFWRLLLDWSRVRHEGTLEPVCTHDVCENATFFPEVRLSYAENVLASGSPDADDQVAVVVRDAAGGRSAITRRELREQVRAAARGLRDLGVSAGDRVVAVSGNNGESVVGALAAAAIGATFSSAAPDMGVSGLLSRFEPLRPRVLLANLAAGDNTASTPLAERVAAVAAGLPTLTAIVALDDGAAPRTDPTPIVPLADLMTTSAAGAERDGWVRCPFNHPLFVLFSSGTTGPPKCIVHGAGGTLLEHVKEHRLHADLRAADTLFFHTSTAWMMWNWQLSALASGSRIVLYDGPLTGPETLWRLVAEEGVTVFGTSPSYLRMCETARYSPRDSADLRALRLVLSTGSILHDGQFDWFADHVGDLPLQSISGGTDIIGCFVLGNPNLSVRRGLLQCRSLGLDVQAHASPDLGPSSAVGELVCRNPFPSRPIGLVGDADGTGFHRAYFAQNAGVWTHGDLIEFEGDGQARMHGRSDGVLQVGGVSVGPAEIYRALQGVPEVQEAMAVEQRTPGTRGASRLVLLVVLAAGSSLEGRLSVRIRQEIARRTSPAHVPEVIVEVDALPRTHSGKQSERAARDALDGQPVRNADALANPEAAHALPDLVAAATARVPSRPDVDDSTTGVIRAIWETVLGVTPLRPDDNFFDVGGSSLAAVQVFQLIHDRLGVDLPLSTLVSAPTPAELAAVIDSGEARDVPLLVLLKAGVGRPFFIVHAISGDVLALRPLALELDTARPIYGIQARGLDPRARPQTSVAEMADTYLEAIHSVQPHGPYALSGYSFGGLVAFDMARSLVRDGEPVESLALIAPELHHACLPLSRRAAFVAARPLRYAVDGVRAPGERLPRYVRRALKGSSPREPGDLPPLLTRLEAIGREAFSAYRPGRYDGPATLFVPEARRPGSCDSVPVWRRVTGNRVRVERVPGGHLDAVSGENLRVLARRITERLGL